MSVALWALTTLATVKDELGITDDSQDLRLERMIHAATRRFESECNRKFARAEYTERIKGQGMNFLRLAQWPIVAVASVVQDSITLVEDTDFIVLAETGRLQSDNMWRWSAGGHPDLTNDPDPYSARLNIIVTYTAGYVTPAQAEDDDSLARDLPEDLEESAIRWVVYQYNNAPGVKRESIHGGYQREVFSPLRGGDVGILAEMEPFWQKYRKLDRGDA